MADILKEWKKWAEGKEKVCIVIPSDDIYRNTSLFKTHRDYVEYLFNQKGLDVVHFRHTYDSEATIKTWGLVYQRTNSELDPAMEVWGVVGHNVRPKQNA